ncbi:hypothetical protein BH10ACI3_BH10ACI3_27540 [soil metagenome]
MNQTIEISTETAAIIESQAKLVGLSVDDYLKSLMPNGTVNGINKERPLYETATPQELAAAITAWAESHDQNSPGLGLEDVSRESIY